MSDAHIEHGIVELLKIRVVHGLTDLEVHAHLGIAEVCGRAATPAVRQLCLECCRRVTGVRQVVDRLQVCSC